MGVAMSQIGLSRTAALVALRRVRQGMTVSEALQAGQKLRGPDRALTTQLVYGVLRHRRYLDAWISAFRKGNLDVEVREILRLALFQLGFLDRVPVYAVVNAAVEQAKGVNVGAASVVNAILRRGQSYPPNLEALTLGERYSHPDWLIDRWTVRYGDRVENILARDNQIPPLMLRINLTRTTRQHVLQELHDAGIQASPSAYLPEAIRVQGSLWLEDIAAFRSGLVTVQDESSMLVNWALNAQPGENIVDMAVGVGGKAIHVLERTDGQVTLTGLDISQSRLELFRDNLRRTEYEDAVQLVCQPAEQFAQHHAEEYDRVILDAPCSGLGVLRRRVDARWSKKNSDFPGLRHRQTTMLQAAIAMAKPGGVIVYSTCSTEPEETLEVVQMAISAGQVSSEDVTPHLPSAVLGEFVQGGLLLLAPGDLDMDGFFIARLRKRRSG